MTNMMRPAALILALAVCGGTALAQTTGGGQQNATLEGVTLGDSMRQVRDTLGDPVQVRALEDQTIWRYIERGGAVYVDVIPRNNIVSSVTVLRRFDSSQYTDARGVSFGTNAAGVRAKLGAESKETTNADDGSVDLWYVSGDAAWIYELYGDKLGFVQIVARPGSQSTALAGETPIVPADGSSVVNAIRIRPSSFLGNSLWIDAFLAMNQCGGNGHWKETSLDLQSDKVQNDPLAYTVVHAKCTIGDAERVFYFDTHGVATKTSPDGSKYTIYVDPSQLQVPPKTSPSPSATPR